MAFRLETWEPRTLYQVIIILLIEQHSRRVSSYRKRVFLNEGCALLTSFTPSSINVSIIQVRGAS